MPPETTAAPPAAVNIVGETPPSPPPAPTTTIHVDGKGAMDKGPAPAPPKKGSAMDRMRSDLRQKAGVTEPKPPESKPASGEAVSPPESTPPPTSDSTPIPPVEAGAATTPDKKKANPWKLVDEFKGRSAMLEKELAELKKVLPNPEEQKRISAEVEAIRKRNADLEEEIRYVNFSKSKQFTEQYQQPYEQAWQKAMSELGELTVTTEEGQERPLHPNDLLELVNLPIKQARALATEKFGEFAQDVMDHRTKIKGIFEAQQKALEEARKGGEERDKARQQQWQEAMSSIQKQVTEVWQKTNEEALKDETISKYFKPVEGDTEGNQRLERGFALANQALSGIDPRDPRLTPEQRAQVIKVHTAVRLRAAAFGRTMLQLEKAQAENAKLKAELDKYRAVEPGKGEGKPAAQSTGTSSARESIFAALRAKAQ